MKITDLISLIYVKGTNIFLKKIRDDDNNSYHKFFGK